VTGFDCFECGRRIDAVDLTLLADAFLVHSRAEHNWPYSDQAIRNYADATQRLTGPEERLLEVGDVTIHPVTENRIDDWLTFFDHDAFVGNPAWAACYCLEPHVRLPASSGDADDSRRWQDNREAMIDRLRTGATFGYLAYVDGRPAGWVNASKRSQYTLHPVRGGPAGEEVVGVSCFVIAPPYRRHGLAAALLDRVIADAASRGARWVEGYPFVDPDGDAGNFRGPRSLYRERGFEPVEDRDGDVVMRRPV
jgi:GNAT superfamily N-acetyltransferase